MGLKLKKDFECVLQDETGKELLKFSAQQAEDEMETVDFVGGGIASGSQTLKIITEKNFLFKANEHRVIVDGRMYVLANVVPSLRRKLGAKMGKKHVYILDLE